MYYEFNVSKNSEHLFATAERSAGSFRDALRLREELVNKFPESEGYKISCTRYMTTGERVEFGDDWTARLTRREFYSKLVQNFIEETKIVKDGWLDCVSKQEVETQKSEVDNEIN